MTHKEIKDLAWVIYCDTTKGAMSAKDDWNQVGYNEQEIYMKRAMRRLSNKEEL